MVNPGALRSYDKLESNEIEDMVWIYIGHSRPRSTRGSAVLAVTLWAEDEGL